MKKLRTECRSRAAHTWVALSVFFCAVSLLQAQILINIGANPTITFTTTNLATEWATHIDGTPATDGAGTWVDAAAMDASIQALDQSSINQPLVPTNSFGTTQRYAKHNTNAGRIYTLPTGVEGATIKATLRNNSGGNLSALTIAYDNDNHGGYPGSELTQVPGLRVYFSTNGLPNSWMVLSNLSGAIGAGNKSQSVTLGGTWPAGADVYFLWVDDNTGTNPDGTNSIDNVVFTAIGNETCVAITNGPASLTVPERGAALFSVMATGGPIFYQWEASRDGGANYTNIPGAVSPSYTLPSAAYPGDDQARFRATVFNSICTNTSAAAILTVTPDTTAPVVLSAIGDIDPTSGLANRVVLTFSEPMDANTISEANFFVFVTGTDPDDPSTPPMSSVFAGLGPDGVTVTVFTEEERLALTDYSIRMLDIRDASSGNNATDPNPLTVPLKIRTTLISFDGADNEWKYFVSTNIDLWATAPDWMTFGYDDSSWSAGAQPLGNDSSAGTAPQPALRTTIPFSGTLPAAERFSEPAFFRHGFYVPSSTNGLTLNMRYLFEDGGVVFINGVEAGRFNVAGNTVLNFGARATANAADPTPISGPVSLPLTNVFPGTNVIAVVVIQNGTSSDVDFALELTATVSKFAGGAPSIIGQPQSQNVPEGANVTFSVSAEGALPLTYHWSKGGSPIPGANGPSYSISGVLPSHAGNYSVIVSNSLGTSNSQIATLVVNADNINPVFVSAVASTNGTSITLTMTDTGGSGINFQTATNPANYTVTSPSGNLTVLSAVQTSPSNVVLTTEARTPGTCYTVTANGVVDQSAAANPLTPNSRAAVMLTPVMGYGAAWKYDQSGLNLSNAWFASSYNDSAWPSGGGVLGREDSAGALILFTNIAGGSGTNTVLELTNNNGGGVFTGSNNVTVTYYFRTTVNVPFDPNVTGNSLRLRAYIDDGAAIYVNGVEQFRFNLTNNAGYTNLAMAGSTEGAGGIIASNIAGFVQGNNVIAVEVHQSTIGSSDVAWAMELEGLVTVCAASCPQPSISYNAGDGKVTISWTGAATLEETTELKNPSASTVWGPSSAANGVAFSPTGIMKFYRLSCP